MCGIAGVATLSEFTSDREIVGVKNMMQAQVHRGPDDSGLYHDHRIVLGHQRLAIIDLSPLGKQPMSNEDGSIWIVYNGEIYNYRELRNELAQKGHTFSSHSDTEILIHGYEEWGIEGLLDRLIGMFAFVFYENKRKSGNSISRESAESEFELILARDRLGKKPLYYFWNGNQLLFASEVKALLASGIIEAQLNHAAIQGFLMFGSVPSPLTVIEGVKALEPATYVRLGKGKLEQKRYWSIAFNIDEKIKEQEIMGQLQNLLVDSVKGRMISDVPLGVFLSGGIDSSAIVSLMRAVTDGPLRSYSLSFKETEFDTGYLAELVARRFRTEHVKWEVTSKDVLCELPQIVRAMDQPTIDGINTYFVSKLARKSGTTVALSGVGGDEIFGGYKSFRQVPQLFRLSQAAHLIPGLRWLLERALDFGEKWTRAEKLKIILQYPPSIESAYLCMRGLFLDGQLEALSSNGLLENISSTFSPVESLRNLSTPANTNFQNVVSLLEMRAYLHNQLLRDTDVMSMAHGLEVRAPLLDHRVVEFLSRVPIKYKFTKKSKQLLWNSIPTPLPPEVTSHTKMGFTFPFDSWFRTSWKSFLEEKLFVANDQLFDIQTKRILWSMFLQGKVHWSKVWCLVVLQLWLTHMGSTADQFSKENSM